MILTKMYIKFSHNRNIEPTLKQLKEILDEDFTFRTNFSTRSVHFNIKHYYETSRKINYST